MGNLWVNTPFTGSDGPNSFQKFPKISLAKIAAILKFLIIHDEAFDDGRALHFKGFSHTPFFESVNMNFKESTIVPSDLFLHTLSSCL